jgi:hypothetical protein
MQVNKSNDHDRNSKNNNPKNYLKPLKKGEERDTTKAMRSKEDLHAIIHKLKNHYNDLVKIRTKKSIKLNELKKRTRGLNKQIEDKLAFSDIEFPNEKISIEDYEKFKNSSETKETIRIKIVKLIAEKNKISEKYNGEIEFRNKINNLIKIENNNIEDLYIHVIEMQEKINTIRVAEKNLEKNREEKIKKEKIFMNVKNELDKELIKIEDVTDFQTRNHKKMIEELKAKNEGNQKFMKEIDMKDINLDKEHKKNADKILNDISKSKMIKSLNTEKEKYVIKLILGLDIIKRYFIDITIAREEINTEILLKSEDLKTFYSEKFYIKENFESMGYSSLSYFNSNNNNNINSNNNYNDNPNLIKSISDFSNSNSIGEKSTNGKCYISIKTLKEKLDNLDIDYEKIFDFYTKIMNKTNFFHNQMMNFNSKQIALESRKELNLKRVREIILKNKKNIEALEKFDKKFIVLFNKFKNEIDNGNLYENLKEKLKVFKFNSSPSIYEEFYKKCKIYFSDMKTLNEYIKYNLKKMKIDCFDNNLKNIIKEKYKVFKENIRCEKNSKNLNINEYIDDLFNIFDIEFSKESKKLEKIERVIEVYPNTSKKSKSILRENTINSLANSNFNNSNNENNINNFENINGNLNLNINDNTNININEEFIENTLPRDSNLKINLNLNESNNRDDLDIDNFINENGIVELNLNLDEKKDKENEELNKNNNNNNNDNDKININNNLNNNDINNNDFNNIDFNKKEKINEIEEENLIKRKSAILSPVESKDSKINDNNKIQKISSTKNIIEEKNPEPEKSVKSQSIKNSEFSSNNIYIAPYSGWSIQKLNEEREISLNKIENLKKYLEVIKFFKEPKNMINLKKLEVPFEQTLFYFFENTDKLVDNLKLTKNVVDTFNKLISKSKLKTQETVKNILINNIKEGKYKLS